jgi:hypothetical protein
MARLLEEGPGRHRGVVHELHVLHGGPEAVACIVTGECCSILVIHEGGERKGRRRVGRNGVINSGAVHGLKRSKYTYLTASLRVLETIQKEREKEMRCVLLL